MLVGYYKFHDNILDKTISTQFQNWLNYARMSDQRKMVCSYNQYQVEVFTTHNYIIQQVIKLDKYLNICLDLSKIF